MQSSKKPSNEFAGNNTNNSNGDVNVDKEIIHKQIEVEKYYFLNAESMHNGMMTPQLNIMISIYRYIYL
jgi:hypothetical protein